MLDGADLAFAAALERWIKHELRGDDGEGGLFRALTAAQDMAQIIRTQATIAAYEGIFRVMKSIAREMNEPHQRADGPGMRAN